MKFISNELNDLIRIRSSRKGMIPIVWLHSKTTIPEVTSNAVERQRLVNLFRESGPKKLTIVRAPAGYGKTTLLSQWVSRLDEPVVWLVIDATDNDPIRFWKYVIHAVSDVVPEEVRLKLFSLFNGQLPLEYLIDSFLNEINLFQGKLQIVMDDYHLIENPVIHNMMVRLIDYLPSNIFLYMTSRTEFPLPLAKWRVRGWLMEIGVDQLRFTYEEMERFYKKRKGTHENVESLQYVFRITEGWAAGLQLVDLSEKISTAGEWDIESLNSPHPFATEFLLQEILASLSPTTQDFLVKTSIFNQLDPVICDALTERTDSGAVLLELEKKGLFIVRLKSSKPTFRYHHLFAETLQVELTQRYSSEVIAGLYKNAASGLHEQGDFMAAIELALQGELYEVADTWITIYLIEIFTSGQTATFMRWIRTLRDDGYSVNLETLVMYILTLSTTFEMEEARHIIIELDRRHEVDRWMDNGEFQGMASILETVRAFVLLGGGKDVALSMGVIANQMDKGRVSSRWDHIPMQYNWFEPTLLRTSLGVRGRLLWPEEILPLLDLFQEDDVIEKNLTGFGFGVSAETSYYRNSMDLGIIELEAALQYAHHFKDASLFIPMYILKGRIYAAKKQFLKAQEILEYAMTTTKERHWKDSLRTMKAYCYLLEGQFSQAEQELTKSTGLNSPFAESEQDFWLLVYVRLLLIKGQPEDAFKISVRVNERALRERQVLTIIESAMLEAVCQRDLGNAKGALETLHKALELGEPYGYIRLFLDELPLKPLLQKYLKIRRNSDKKHWNTVSISYVEQLVSDDEEDLYKKPLVDKLTPREQSVLKLLASGASNSEIASQLSLSEGTIRVYLSHIYSKIGVNSRTKAILWVQNE